ncbi:MAG: hypothetical protein GY788_21185 [bacterium]|nr:hypothetical protein [bacterium]
MNPRDSYTIEVDLGTGDSHAYLTVNHTDARGETWDLNAYGEPCRTEAELRDFIAELHTQGCFDAATRDALLEEVG